MKTAKSNDLFHSKHFATSIMLLPHDEKENNPVLYVYMKVINVFVLFDELGCRSRNIRRNVMLTPF
jgi:hypothetical protein